MSQATEPTAVPVPTESDVVANIQRVLRESPEPLTASKIRAQLPAAQRAVDVEDIVRRQAASNVLQVYPKYRSANERYWDRPMPVHVAALVRGVLADGALAATEVRRKLPAYAQALADQVLQEELAQGRLHRHPRATSRGSERVGLTPPDAGEYLRPELSALFLRMEQLGFSQARLRQAAIEVLHDEEWAPTPTRPAEPKAESARQSETAAAESQPSGQPS